MSNHKMKGLLKGLRYISHIFDNEKEQDMQIGYPTDVKHVAHIGWDGPSVNSPSWMNEFKSAPEFASAPLNVTGDMTEGSSVKWVSEELTLDTSNGRRGARDPDLPKSSRRNVSTGSPADSPTRDKSEGSRRARKSSKNSNKDSGDSSTRASRQPKDPSDPNSKLPDIPKKSRRKKSKDSSSMDGGSSSRSSRRAQASKSADSMCDSDSVSGSVSKSNNRSELGEGNPGGGPEGKVLTEIS